MPLLAAELISTTGSAMTMLALPWLVLETTGSAAQAGLVATAEFVPMAVLGIPSGQIVARLGPRRTMLTCDLARAPLLGLVPLLEHTGHLSVGILIVIAFGIGAFYPAHFASQRTIIPDLLGTDSGEVTRANALLQAANRLPLVIGPAIAGSLIALIGAGDVILIDAISYLVAAALLTFLVPRGLGRQGPQEEEATGMWAGARFIASDPLLGPLTGSFALMELAMQALLLSLPILAFTAFDERSGVAGALLAAWGIGALAGTLPALALSGRDPVSLIRAGVFVESLPIWIVALDLPAIALALPLALAGSPTRSSTRRPAP